MKTRPPEAIGCIECIRLCLQQLQHLGHWIIHHLQRFSGIGTMKHGGASAQLEQRSEWPCHSFRSCAAVHRLSQALRYSRRLTLRAAGDTWRTSVAMLGQSRGVLRRFAASASSNYGVGADMMRHFQQLGAAGEGSCRAAAGQCWLQCGWGGICT